MSIFFCDSNCELWYTRQEQLGIKYISMPYTLEDKEYFFDLGKTTDYKGFYKAVRAGAVPKTSALNVQNYIECFEPWLQKGEDIIYITFSRKMSATFSQMDQAIEQLKEKYPECTIRTFDTCSISIGAAQQVYAAALMHKDGIPDEEIITRLEEIKMHTCTIFTPFDLMHLYRGGRLTKGKAFLGTLFNLKPLLCVKPDGTLYNYAKTNGRRKAIASMLTMMDKMEVDTTLPIIVVDADCEADAKVLCDLITDRYGANVELWTQPVGPVIGSHCGPGTLGLSFRCKKEIQ